MRTSLVGHTLFFLSIALTMVIDASYAYNVLVNLHYSEISTKIFWSSIIVGLVAGSIYKNVGIDVCGQDKNWDAVIDRISLRHSDKSELIFVISFLTMCASFGVMFGFSTFYVIKMAISP